MALQGLLQGRWLLHQKSEKGSLLGVLVTESYCLVQLDKLVEEFGDLFDVHVADLGLDI